MKISIRVIPNAKKSRIVKEENCLKVYVTAPPVENKANKAVIEILSDYFNTKKKTLILQRECFQEIRWLKLIQNEHFSK